MNDFGDVGRLSVELARITHNNSANSDLIPDIGAVAQRHVSTMQNRIAAFRPQRAADRSWIAAMGSRPVLLKRQKKHWAEIYGSNLLDQILH